MKIDNSGFTLVELAVAILIFAIGITGMAAMQMEALKGNSYSTAYNDGVNIAKDYIEEQHSAGTFIENSATGVRYSCQVNRSSVTTGGHPATKMTVDVSWGRLLLTQHYVLSTVLDPNS